MIGETFCINLDKIFLLKICEFAGERNWYKVFPDGWGSVTDEKPLNAIKLSLLLKKRRKIFLPMRITLRNTLAVNSKEVLLLLSLNHIFSCVTMDKKSKNFYNNSLGKNHKNEHNRIRYKFSKWRFI